MVVALLLAVAAAAAAGLVPGLGSAADPEPADPRQPPPVAAGLSLRAPAAPAPVLAASAGGPAASARAVRRVLRPVLADRSLGRHVAMEVRPLTGSDPLLRTGRPVVTPASTVKLLTTLAALEALGPRHRFETRVLAAGRRTLVLVGGGDPLLTAATPRAAAAPYPRPASLQTLASRTAAALAEREIRSVRLRYDGSRFVGPAVNPAWEPTYVPESEVSPIGALWIEEGRETRGFARRVADPAATAAIAFTRQLRRSGITVVGTPTEVTGSRGREVAAVQSPAMRDVVEHVLETSDNEGAEVLLRSVARATGRPASFEGGTAAVRDVLRGLGIDVRGLRLYDGSGLARGDRVSVTTLVQALQLAADPEHPQLRPVVSSLPVAGFTGSLAYRFFDAPAGAGWVRAKTGTLSGVHGLAGIVTTARGTPLVFAVVADRVRLALTLDARAQLDRITATLAACTC